MAALNLRASLIRAEERMARPKDPPQATEESLRTERFQLDELPSEVRDALINIESGDHQSIAADVVAYYAFNYGAPRALSFASGLPLSALYRAVAMPGFRPKSHALLNAVIRFRGQGG